MLLRKLKRELWQQKTQFLAIFSMAFIGLLAFAGMDAESAGAELSVTEYYERTNMADYWIKGAWFTEDDCKALERLGEIRTVQRCTVMDGTAPMLVTGDTDAPEMIVQFVEENVVSKPETIQGKEFDIEEKGIWLDERFAERQHLQPEDELTLEIGGERITYPIKGIIRAPEYVHYTSSKNEMMPDYGSFGFAFLPGSCHPFAESKEKLYDTLQVDAEEGSVSKEEADRIKSSIIECLELKDLMIEDRSMHSSCERMDSEIEEHRNISFMFPGIFLVIAFLGIITTMARMTANQRMQIGTMKALGFSNAAVLQHYISFGFAVSLSGSVMGAVVGFLVLPEIMQKSMGQTFLLPEWKTVFTGKVYAAVILVTLLSTGVCYLACRKELSETPAKALRPKSPRVVKASRFEKGFLWKQLDFAMQWNIRDMCKNKLRTGMGILGSAGCMMLLICAFGCMDSIAYMPENMYERLLLGKQTIWFEEATDAFTVGEYAKKYSGQEMQICSAEFTSLSDVSEIESGYVTVIGEGNLIRLQDSKQREVTFGENEVMLSRKMAELLDIEEGSLLRFRILGEDEEKTVRIAGLYQDPSVQGITMSRAMFEDLEFTYMPQRVLTNHALPQWLTEEDGIKSVQDSEQLRADMLASMDVMNMIVFIMALAAVVLGLVVLYNLSELSFVEKIREYSTLKVLGMEEKIIKKIMSHQNFLIGIAGIIVGIPMGDGFLRLMWSSMSDSLDVIVCVSTKSYIYSALITLGVIWISGKIMALRLKGIHMVDALKGVE